TTERDSLTRLAGAALHMAGSDRVPAAGARGNPIRDRAWSTVSTHAVKAIQKNTSDTVVNQCHPVSTAVAYVAAEYIPSGNTAAHQFPERSLRLVHTSNGIHAVATIHVTTVTGHTLVSPAL